MNRSAVGKILRVLFQRNPEVLFISPLPGQMVNNSNRQLCNLAVIEWAFPVSRRSNLNKLAIGHHSGHHWKAQDFYQQYKLRTHCKPRSIEVINQYHLSHLDAF